MKCDNCHQNPATVHLTEICDGVKVEKHLCKACASKEGIAIKSQVSLDKMFSDLVVAHKEVDDLNELVCPQCGMNWAEFRQSGLLGCPNDYVVFGKALEQVIARSHEGATRHINIYKTQKSVKPDQQLEFVKLKKELQKAIENEDYETAASLRDQINHISTVVLSDKSTQD